MLKNHQKTVKMWKNHQELAINVKKETKMSKNHETISKKRQKF